MTLIEAMNRDSCERAAKLCERCWKETGLLPKTVLLPPNRFKVWVKKFGPQMAIYCLWLGSPVHLAKEAAAPDPKDVVSTCTMKVRPMRTGPFVVSVVDPRDEKDRYKRAAKRLAERMERGPAPYGGDPVTLRKVRV